MARIQIGCETYTWQMPGEHYKGRMEHILDITARAGFAGIEPETSFLRELSDPARMRAALDARGLQMPVLCLAEKWEHPEETPDERTRADQWIAFLTHFPGTLLLLVPIPGVDRSDLEARRRNIIGCTNCIARRAGDRGIRASFHPNSPPGSVFRTREDYMVLLDGDGLDPEAIGYTPDVGHIARGGMAPASILSEFRDRIDCVHYKDMHADGSWARMGEGEIDFPALTTQLVDADFDGWIIVEDECDAAVDDPDAVVLADGVFVRETLAPLVEG